MMGPELATLMITYNDAIYQLDKVSSFPALAFVLFSSMARALVNRRFITEGFASSSPIIGNRDHVGVKKFREINWLPTKERFEQCVCIFKFFKHMSYTYTAELYKPFNHGHNTRRSNCRLQLPYRITSYGH